MSLTTDSDGSPIKVTGTTDTDTQIWSGVAHIKFIQWYKPTTVGHKLTLKDAGGREIVNLYCDVADQAMWAPIWGSYDQIRCDDMDSGTLYIYFK